MKIYMHVNYLENIFPIEEIVTRAAAAGYDGIELRGYDIGGNDSLEHYLVRCLDFAARQKLDIVFGCPNNTTPGIQEDSIRRMKAVIRIAGEGGVKILNVFAEGMKGPTTPYHHFELNGSAVASDDDYIRTADYFRKVGEFAAEYGIALCFETHNCYLHDLSNSTTRLLRMIGNDQVKANFDYGNIFLNRSNRGLDLELSSLAPHLGYAHVKNLIAFNQYDSRLLRGSPLAEGDINTFVFMRKLLATGYCGPVTIENVLLGDKRRWLIEDRTYLASILADLKSTRSAHEPC